MRTHSILRRLGALALAVVMTLSLVTMPALAEENPDTGDTLVEDAAPVTTGGEGQPEGESKTDGGETPVETTQATEAPVETTQATEAPTENPEPTETTEVTEPTETTEVTEPTEETTQLTQQELEQIAQVQAMIDALPTTITPDQQEAFVQQYQTVTAAIQALSPAQQELLNLTNYQAAAQAVMALEEDRALDGPVEVGTVEELREALAKGGEIHLTQSITVSDDRFLIGGEQTADGNYLPVENYRDVLLDLGGNTVTCEGNATRAFQILTGHKVVIQNGTIENMLSTGRCVDLQARANVQLINLTLKTSGEGNSQTVNIGANTDDTVLEIRGCTIDSGTAGYALIAFGRSTISISNSNLSGFAAIYMRKEKSDNGTFTSKGSTVTVHNSTLTGKNPHAGPTNEFGVISMQVPVTVTVRGNSIINAIGTGDCPQYVVDAYPVIEPGLKVTIDESTTLNLTPVAGKAQLLDPTLDITKNTVVVPSKYASDLPEDLKLDANNKVVQKITNEERLRAAVNAGGNVVLEGNITLSEPLVIPQGKSVTLNLNGFTLENSKDFREDSLVIVDSGASLVVTGNGTIRSAGNGIKMTQDNGYDPNKTASLVMESGTVEAKSAAIIGNGTRHGTSITINGGTLKGDGGAIYHPQQGKVVINGGSLTGGEFGVEMRAGELTVNGGTITATSKDFNIGANGSGSTTHGVAVAVVPYSADRPVTVTINNGKLKGQHALHQEILKDNTGDVTLAVNGGTFTGEVVAKGEEKFISGGSFSNAPAENLVVENWSVTQNPDGFGVQEDPFIVDQDGNKEHVDPSKPLVLDELLEKNKEKDAVSLTISADAQVNKDHVLSGTLRLEADGHRITGSGSIRTGKKLELKDFGSLKTRVTLPEGGKLVFKDGRVQVLPSERTNDDHEGVGYSVPVIITVGDSTYTYFLSMDPDNAGKIVLDETGKPLVLGQYYSSKGDDAKAPEFTFVYISSHGTYYLGRHTDMTFVSSAPIPSMDYITIDGDPVEGKYLTEPDDEDTASVTLSYRFLRNLDTGKHTIRMYFKDGSRAKAEFSVRKTSVYDPENPKTGDTIFLPLAVMTLSAAALAVLMPRKKKYL